MTAIETRTAGVMVRVVEPFTLPDAAVTIVFPTATLLANPVAFTVAMVLSAVFQLTVLVRSIVLPSL